jgi:hypothetical protein
MKIKRFNESEEFEQEFELPKEEQPMFSMRELESAFLAARMKTHPQSESGKPGFRTFKDWYLQELGGKIDMDDYPFDMHTIPPFKNLIMNQFR